jgi:hypothetical protein
MADSYIDYDFKVQNALRGVVRSVLIDTEKEGLAGEHHFYIAFKTQAEGVMIPDHLISRFPDEMTIVLQHKYWGLKVFEDYFEIGLSFNQTPEHLTIPFAAVTGFVDPSVQFALQFHDENTAPSSNLEGNNETIFPADANSVVAPAETTDNNATFPQTSFDKDQSVKQENGDETSSIEEDTSKEGDNVVTLDAFRKK